MSYSLAFLTKGRPPGSPDRPLISSTLPASSSGHPGATGVPRSRRGSASSQSSVVGPGVGGVTTPSKRGSDAQSSVNRAYLDSLAALDDELKRESAEAELAIIQAESRHLSSKLDSVRLELQAAKIVAHSRERQLDAVKVQQENNDVKLSSLIKRQVAAAAERERLVKAIADAKASLDEVTAASVAAQNHHDECMLLSRIRYDNKERSALADLESCAAQLSDVTDKLSSARQSCEELAVIQSSIADMRVTLDKAKVSTTSGVDTYSAARLYEYLQMVSTETEQLCKDRQVAIALLEAEKSQLLLRQSQVNADIDSLRQALRDGLPLIRASEPSVAVDFHAVSASPADELPPVKPSLSLISSVREVTVDNDAQRQPPPSTPLLRSAGPRHYGDMFDATPNLEKLKRDAADLQELLDDAPVSMGAPDSTLAPSHDDSCPPDDELVNVGWRNTLLSRVMSAVNSPVKPPQTRPYSASFSATATPRDVPSSRRSVTSLPTHSHFSRFAASVGKTSSTTASIQVHSRRARSVEPQPQLKLLTRAPLPYPDWKTAAEATVKSPRSPRSQYNEIPSKVSSFIRQSRPRDPVAFSRQQRSVERLTRSRSLEPVSVVHRSPPKPPTAQTFFSLLRSTDAEPLFQPTVVAKAAPKRQHQLAQLERQWNSSTRTVKPPAKGAVSSPEVATSNPNTALRSIQQQKRQRGSIPTVPSLALIGSLITDMTPRSNNPSSPEESEEVASPSAMFRADVAAALRDILASTGGLMGADDVTNEHLRKLVSNQSV